MHRGFEPVFDEESRILVLGSFPSVMSRKINFYYGNPSNRFWPMLEKVFGEPVPKETENKIEYLKRHKLAIWDALRSADIEGSSDTELTYYNSEPVDLDIILKKAVNLSKIVCNGKKAYEIYDRKLRISGIPAVCLPSTSPRNVSFSYEPWINELSVLKTR